MLRWQVLEIQKHSRHMRNELEATKEQPELLISQDHALGNRLVYADQGVLAVYKHFSYI